MGKWAYDGLNGLHRSLKATGVLSKDYQATIFSWALQAAKEARDAGFEEGKESVARSRIANTAVYRYGVVPLKDENRWAIIDAETREWVLLPHKGRINGKPEYGGSADREWVETYAIHLNKKEMENK